MLWSRAQNLMGGGDLKLMTVAICDSSIALCQSWPSHRLCAAHPLGEIGWMRP